MNSTMMYSDVDFVSIFNGICEGKATSTNKSVETLLLDRNADIHECIIHTNYENLDIIPSCLTLSEAEERIKGDVISPQQTKLKRHLKKVEDEYDYCIIDTSPSLSIININGLVAADELYIPLKCDGGSLLGVSIIMSILNVVKESNPGLKMGGMFLHSGTEGRTFQRLFISCLVIHLESTSFQLQSQQAKMWKKAA